MSSPDWFSKGLEHIWLPYTQMKTASPPLPVIGTHGSRIVLADGSELVDGIASWWTACHGYNHPHIQAAVLGQLETMPHIMFGGLVHEQALNLAACLAGLLPGDLTRVFFCESGSVAVEVALKMAVQYWLNAGVQNRNYFVAFKGGYHGDTFAAMAICDPDEGMHRHFSGILSKQFIADLPIDEEKTKRLEVLLDKNAHGIAAMIVEPLVQGAGGMKFHGVDVLKRLRWLADRYDVLLIFDEIFTGFGRTGQLFAAEEADIVPDIMTLSKALTGGTLPLAAAIARKHIFKRFWSDRGTHALMHGPTYMANPLGCAAANASLDLFAAEPRLRQVAKIQELLTQGLEPCRELPNVKDVRVKGAIGVVELNQDFSVDDLKTRFIQMGVFIRPFSRIIYLTPAFTIAEDDLKALTDAIFLVLRN